MSFKEVSLSEIKINPFDKIGKQWFLLTCGTMEKYNMMTASWGMLGFMWGKPVVNTVVRPQRYTNVFMEENDVFTISFFDEEHRHKLNICGTKSGRDIDKTKECGFTANEFDGAVGFDESNMVIVCKKIYSQEIDPQKFLDEKINNWYENKDYHISYVAEVLKIYVKE